MLGAAVFAGAARPPAIFDLSVLAGPAPLGHHERLVTPLDCSGTAVTTHVFISYAREDASIAAAVAERLISHDLTVWWDRSLVAGEVFAAAINKELEAATRVVVLWSNNSVRSPWVLDEAARARDLGKLLPIRIDSCAIPLGFGSLNTIEYQTWLNESAKLATLIRQRTSQGATSAPSPAPQAAPAKEEAPPVSPARDQESILWDSIKDSDSSEDFDFYVRRHPNGRFTTLARLKAAKLKAAAASKSTSSSVATSSPQSFQALENKARGSGDVNAMFDLGEAYYWGDGVEKDYAKSRTWFELAAAKGHPEAMFRLGTIYDRGRGVAEDVSTAISWFEKAEQLDSSGAARSLGIFHAIGRGVPVNPEKAFAYYKKSAELGNIGAMGLLAEAYYRGRGCPQDYALALQWATKAANAGDADGMATLAGLHLRGNGIPADAVTAAIWYSRAAEAGDALSMTMLGTLYQQGLGVEQNLARARQWYEKAAANGNGDAMWRLGTMFQRGDGVAVDYAIARQWYEKGAEAGDRDAMGSLGLLYEYGYGVAPSSAQACKWYRAAADAGDPWAMFSLGTMYLSGNGVAADDKEAYGLMRRSAELGDVNGMAWLGVMLKDGVGVAVDDVEAVKWLKASIERRPTAMPLRNLARMQRAGRGTAPDPEGARKSFEMGLELGDASVKWDLAIYYDEGIGGPTNAAGAAKLILDCVDAGEEVALEHFGNGLRQWNLHTRVALQKILQEMGLYKGLMDGAYTRDLEEAIERFLVRSK